MKIGLIGAGKLGLPVALAIEDKGHDTMVYDIRQEDLARILESRELPYQELVAPELLKTHTLKQADAVQDIVQHSDIVFLAVQTPHDREYEGDRRIPFSRKDFDYTYLKSAVGEVAKWAEIQEKKTTLVIISTVLPGTVDRELRHLLNPWIDLAYNPFFIAMGQVIPDFVNPEFVLLGADNQATIRKVTEFYASIHDKKVIEMPIIDAELTKVAYNTYIGMKIVFANTLMEICQENGGNVDNVTGALKQATDRLISPKYLNAGMGDGGGCHPRDNIAMSWLAGKLGLSHNFFDDIMRAREHQTEYLAKMALEYSEISGLPIWILGRAFKPETDLETGSPAILMANILAQKQKYVVHLGREKAMEANLVPAVYFIGTQHREFLNIKFPENSVVIDPFGYITPEQAEGSKLIHVGRH